MKLNGKVKCKQAKMLILMLAIIFISMSLLCENIVFANEGVIEYRGKITKSGNTVGLFYVDGRIAFCMDHSKPTPPNGTEIKEKSIYSNSDVIKCLYYGWEGPGQWSEFNGDRDYGIVATSLALDHYVNGSNYIITRPFIEFLDNASFPESTLNFSTTEFNATIQGERQVTNSATVTGSQDLSLKFNLSDDITIVCENRNWSKTGGNIEVTNGDVIHFEAPLTKTGNWTSEQIANSYVWNAILSKSYNDNLQRIVRLGEKDPGTYTNFTINFIDTVELDVIKTDAKNNEIKIPGVEFEIYEDTNRNSIIDNDDIFIDTIVTNEEGIAKSKSIDSEEKSKILKRTKQYILKETKHDYRYIDEQLEEVIDFTQLFNNGENVKSLVVTKEISNKPIEVTPTPEKIDRDTGKPLQGAEFDIYEDVNANGKLDDIDKKVCHYITDKNGTAKVEPLRLGDYIWFETKAPKRICT